MKRTVNYSGRKIITTDDFHLKFQRQDESRNGLSVEVTWDLSKLNIPSNSVLILEVEGRGRFYRFELGEIDDGLGEALVQLGLVHDLSTIRAELFATSLEGNLPRIVAASAPVALLVGGDSDEASQSFLPLRVEPDLDTLWRLNFESGTPVLEVSGRYGAPHIEPWFAVAVLPSVVKEVFLTISLGLENLNGDDEEVWRQYFENSGVSLPIPESDELSNEHILNIFDRANQVSEWFTKSNSLLKLGAKDE